jgi:Tol biopolymer transport system component
MKRALIACLAACCLTAAAAAPAHAQDSDAPKGAPPNWLPPEEWVNLLWLPYDEAKLYAELHMTRGQVFRWVRIDATNTLAELARRRGMSTKTLARRLVAGRHVRAATKRTLVRHAERTLTQAHLGQHLLFHALHQTAIPARARGIFGVASNVEFLRLRRAELSPLQIGELHHVTRVELLHRSADALKDAVRKGVRSGNLSPAQARVMLDRQLRQLPRWLGQNRYNGPSGGRNAPNIPDGDVAKHPTITADGRQVVWDAYRQNVRQAERQGEIHVSAADLTSLRRVEISPAVRPGSRRPHSAYNSVVSADGAAVAFETAESTYPLAKRVGQMSVLVRDLHTGRMTKVSHAGLPAGAPTRTAFNPAISGDGQRVVYEATDNGRGGAESTSAVWLFDRLTGAQRKIADEQPGGAAYLPRISGDGATVAYTEAAADGRTLIFAQDVASGARTLVSRASGAAGAAADSDAFEPSLSRDGRTVAFTSSARNLGVGGARRTRVYVRTPDGRTELASGGVRGDASQPALSADGRYVAFVERLKPVRFTLAGLRSRVWLFDRQTHTTSLVSRRSGAAGGAADGYASEPSVSADGTRVAFASTAGNLSPRKAGGLTGVFVRDLAAHTTTLLSAHAWPRGARSARAAAAAPDPFGDADHGGFVCPLTP